MLWALWLPSLSPPVAADAPVASPVSSLAQKIDLTTIPQVVLADRMPAYWISNRADQRPLTPERWRRRMPRRCRTRGGYRAHCQGERKVTVSEDPEVLKRAQWLALGHRATARWILQKRPLPEWMAAVKNLDAQRKLTFPVPSGYIGRGFGKTRKGAMKHKRHNGTDIGAKVGTGILAARGGLTMYADNELTGYGNVIILLHADGYSTMYAHCEQLLAAPGEIVERGQLIAKVGKTGFASGAHLHFEWRQRGWPRNPARHFLDKDPKKKKK